MLTCLLVAILVQWVPPPIITPGSPGSALLILAYPAIVPTSPGRTLWVSLLAASMEPVALWIADLRGIPFDHSIFYYLWEFLPTYLCGFIAMVPGQDHPRAGPAGAAGAGAGQLPAGGGARQRRDG